MLFAVEVSVAEQAYQYTQVSRRSRVVVEVAGSNAWAVVAYISFVEVAGTPVVGAGTFVEEVGRFVVGVGMLCSWNRTFVGRTLVVFLFGFCYYYIAFDLYQ